MSRSSRGEAVVPGDTQVERFAGRRAEWDGFVDESPTGTFFHLFGWRDVLEAAFGFRTHYLAARRDGWTPNPPRYTSGVLGKYARLVQGAETGAVTNVK